MNRVEDSRFPDTICEVVSKLSHIRTQISLYCISASLVGIVMVRKTSQTLIVACEKQVSCTRCYVW